MCAGEEHSPASKPASARPGVESVPRIGPSVLWNTQLNIILGHALDLFESWPCGSMCGHQWGVQMAQTQHFTPVTLINHTQASLSPPFCVLHSAHCTCASSQPQAPTACYQGEWGGQGGGQGQRVQVWSGIQISCPCWACVGLGSRWGLVRISHDLLKDYGVASNI